MLRENLLCWKPENPAKPMPFEDLRGEFEHWLLIQKVSNFVLGDILAFGEVWYGDDSAEAPHHWADLIPETYNPESLRVYKWVSENVPPENRFPSTLLSWSHHRAVAALPQASQKWWLQKAIDNRWSAKILGQKIADQNIQDARPASRWVELASRTTSIMQQLIDRLIALDSSLAGSELFKSAYDLMDSWQRTAVTKQGAEVDEEG